MSCILPHKQAILNLSQDLSEKGATKPGIPWVVQDYSKSVVVIKEFEDSVRYYFPNEFDMSVAEIKKTETKLEWGSSYRRDNIKTTYRIIPNKEFLDKLDAKRKELGIYDSKLSLSDYFEDLQEQYDIINNKEVKPGVSELFESNPELANAVYEALGFKQRNQVGENSFNTVVNFDLNKIRSVSGKLGEQGATSDGIRDLLKYVGVDLTNVNTESIKAMADYLRSNPSERNKVLDLLKKEPIKLSQLPDGSYDLKDGNHRATILYYSGVESIPAIITDNTNTPRVKEEYTGPFGGAVSPTQETITPQQKQQAQQLYSQYLDSIFPDSKVKDIVYHGSSYGFEGENFDTSIMINGRTQGDGVYFSTDRKAAERFADISESMYEMFTAQEMQKYLKVAVVNAEKVINGNEVIVQPEQIHILGGKQDIEGFKEFVEGKPIDSEFASEIKESVQFIQEQILSPEMVEIIKNNHPQLQDGMTQLELDFMNRMPNKEC